MRMPGRSFTGLLPPLTPEESTLSARLRTHVTALAETIGDRNIWRPDALEQAARYIEQSLRDAGHTPAAQIYVVGKQSVRNIDVDLPGTSKPHEILVVGAHYDSVPGCPAANDNASGVAALLEIARGLHGQQSARTIRLVAFVNEEPPFFQTEDMGSLVYARRCRQRNENVIGMLSLETIGYYSDEKGSQQYPFPLNLFYPGTGNFIAFVGNLRSKDFVHDCVRSFREHTSFPSEGAAPPELTSELGWSDHWSFWQTGYPALMVTDTAPFRYSHYHRPTDTPDKLDYDRTARVTSGLLRTIQDLARS